jgi:peptidoglycan/LPS O-acetylase OafA/YrhL
VRLKSIDFLRGFAVILVLFSHYWAGIDYLKTVGWVGVDLFFVLSGFLVSGLLFSEHKKFGNVKPGLFLIRRGFKIYPLFIVTYLLTAIAFFSVGFDSYDKLNERGRLLTWIGETVFLQNYIGSFWPHHWSLAVEEHFYFLVAMTFPLLLRYMRFAPVVFIACLAMRIGTALFTNLDGTELTHLRLDSLFMGVSIAYVYHFGDLKGFHNRYKWLLVAAMPIPLLFMFQDSHSTIWIKTVGYSLLYVSFSAWLILFLYNDFSNIPGYKLVAKIGFYSYGIYLFHMYLVKFVVGPSENVFSLSLVLRFLIYFFGAILFGSFMSWLIEIPTLKMRDKWFPRRSVQLPQPYVAADAVYSKTHSISFN